MATLEEELSHITEIRSLKHKRSARKGNLKRQSNHYLSIKDVPLEKQRLADLKRRLETVIENATAYYVIQDRIEEVEQEVDAKEEGEIRDQRISNNELTDAYQFS